MTKWVLYSDTEFKDFIEENIEDNVGFVYRITNLEKNKKYIGKKLFSKAGYKQVKGKKKKIRKPSDWKNYWGSNEELKADIKKYGKNNFKREVLSLCKSKGDLSYDEAYYQFLYGVLKDDGYYNSWIQCKIHKKHLKKPK